MGGIEKGVPLSALATVSPTQHSALPLPLPLEAERTRQQRRVNRGNNCAEKYVINLDACKGQPGREGSKGGRGCGAAAGSATSYAEAAALPATIVGN